MYRHPSPEPPFPSLPWNLTCLPTAPPPAPNPVPPATFSDYSCIGPSPFFSSTSQNGLNRQRVCMLRDVCVVDIDMLAPDVGPDAAPLEFPPDYDSAFALKSLRMYRPRRLLSAFSDGIQGSTLEELLYQPQGSIDRDGHGLVHLHAWENHHGGDPSAALHVLGASPSVSYSQPPLAAKEFAT